MADYVDQQLGNYRLRRLLGRGGAADVYLGEHIHLETLAAIKILRIEMGSNELDDFRREAKIIAHLLHPNIVRVLEFGVEGNTPFLVMDYAPKGTLRQCYPKGTRLPLTTALPYVKQVARALQYAHDRKVIHRDVKPENMLLGINNEVLLSDFGISAIEQSTSIAITRKGVDGGLAGTTYYMAPEQIQGDPHPASDQYALGIVVYEWLSGSRPFQGEALAVMYKQVHAPIPPLREKIPTLSPLVEQVVLRALAKDPQQRFPSIREFAEALEQASEAQPTATLPSWSISGGLGANPAPPQEATSTQESATLLARPFSEQPRQSPMPVQNGLESSAAGSHQRFYGSTTLAEDARAASEGASKSFQRRGGSIKGRAILLIGLALIIVVGGIAFLLSSLNNPGRATSAVNAQATARAEASATASFRATATAAANAYNSASAREIMAGFDPQHTHLNPYEKVLNTANVSKLVQAWKFSSGGRIGSVPVIANGIVYVSAAGRTTNEGNMYALDAATGHKVWINSAGTYYFAAGPTVADGTVYIGSDNNLYAIDAGKGAIKWTATIGGRIGSSPTLVNGVIYVGADDGKLYAFNASKGTNLWTFATGGTIRSSPAVDHGVVYVGSDDHNLYAIKADGSGVLWTFRAGDTIRSAPSVVNGVVYAGSNDHKLYALSADKGAVLWTALTGNTINSSPAVANGVVYIGSDDNRLYAFNAAGCGKQACSPLWTAPTEGGVDSSPTVANGVVYVGSNDDNLYAFNAAGCGGSSCLPLWMGSTGAEVRSSPMVANGFVYVGSDDGNIYAFHLNGTTP